MPWWWRCSVSAAANMRSFEEIKNFFLSLSPTRGTRLLLRLVVTSPTSKVLGLNAAPNSCFIITCQICLESKWNGKNWASDILPGVNTSFVWGQTYGAQLLKPWCKTTNGLKNLYWSYHIWNFFKAHFRCLNCFDNFNSLLHRACKSCSNFDYISIFLFLLEIPKNSL